MRTIGNLIWIFVFGGLAMAVSWCLIGVVAFISIVGIPWAKSCMTMATFSLLPFGKEAVSRKEITGNDDVGTGVLGLVGNVVWFLFAGVWLSIGHLAFGLLCFLTIIGIPFGIQHLKLAILALAPVGKSVESSEAISAIRKAKAGALR